MTELQDPDLLAVYDIHRAQLKRFLFARLGNESEADDMAQDLWVRVRRARPATIVNGKAYLFRMAENLIIDRLRHRQRRLRGDRIWSELVGSPNEVGIEPIDRSRNPEEALIDFEEQKALALAIARIPKGAHRVFTLHMLEGLSHAEVAKSLGISRSGVEKHMAVAIKYIRRAMLE